MRKQNQSITQDDARRMRRASLLKMAAIAVFIIVVMVFGSVAWFTMNREVEGTGVQMTANDMPFEIMVQGDKGKVYDTEVKNADELKLNDNDYLLPSGDYGYARPAENVTELRTEGGKQKIEWLVNEDYNAKNYGDSSNENFNPVDDIGIRPRSSGVLHFWIVPKGISEMNAVYTIDITAFRKTYAVDSNGKPDYTTETNPTPLTDSDADKILADYVDCHILFFRHYKETTASESNPATHYYSDLLDDSFEEKITFTDKDNDGELDPYKVTIYWIWPETLKEAVLLQSDQNEGRYAVCEWKTVTKKIEIGGIEKELTTAEHEIMNKMSDNPAGFLKGYTGDTIDVGDVKEKYSEFSLKYNRADEEIGENIKYILAELTVSSKN